MKKSIYKKFTEFKKRHGFSNEEIAQIATEYANSDLAMARTYYKEKYDISEKTFYKARDYAVICCLVDNATCRLLRSKAAANYSRNNEKNSAVAPIAHFDKLISDRQAYLDEFSENEILDIGQKYIEGVSLKNIAISHETGEYAIKSLLRKGIVNLYYDSRMVEQLSVIVGPELQSILRYRQGNKEILLDCIQKEISFLKCQLGCYNLYFIRNSKNKPSFETLENNLSNAIKMYNETLKL